MEIFPRRILRKLLVKLLYEDKISNWRNMGVTIGSNVFIGSDATVDQRFASLLTIEDGVVISARTVIMLHDSAFNNVCSLPVKVGRVLIKQQAYIGVNSTILCGVTVGRRAIVGAGSVVTKDVPDETVAFGCPAVVQGTLLEFRTRFEEAMTYRGAYKYWDIPPWRERKQVMLPEEIEVSYRALIHRFKSEGMG